MNEKVSKRAPRPHSLRFTKPSRTKQAFKDECDVNNIMARFEKTALIDHVNQYQGRYGDFTETPQDFHQALNQVLAAREMFATLPAKLRKEFDNDPARFVDFVDGADEDQLREVGLLPALQTDTPAGVPQGAVGEPETTPKGSGKVETNKASQG